MHSADQNANGAISLSEQLRAIHLFSIGSLYCDVAGEDEFNPGTDAINCKAHSSDYTPQNWTIGLGELLRLIQLFNIDAYHPCSGGEDSFCPEP